MPKNINYINSINSINSLLIKTTNYHDIYSLEGTFRIQNDKIIHLIPNDVSVIKLEYKNTNFIIDNSRYIFRKDIYQIPFYHKISNTNKYEYKLDIKSKIALVIEVCLDDKVNINNIKDIYFFTNENELHDYLKNDIIEFISLINNNK